MSLSPNCIVYENVPQRSEAWFKLRAGRLTGCNFKKLLTPTGRKPRPKNMEFGPWGSLIMELCGSFLNPEEIVFEGNLHTDRGTILEPEAREAFCRETGLTVKEVGFVLCKDGPVGCSPDGLIIDKQGDYIAGVEIKSPISKIHIPHLVKGVLPAEHRQQVHGSMAMTGLRTWYFVSYCRGCRMLICKIEWDKYTDLFKQAIDEFKEEYRDKYDLLMPLIRPSVEGRGA